MWGAHAVRAVVVVGRARNRRRGAPAPHPRRDPDSNVGRARRARGRCGRTGEKPPARRAGPTSTTKPRSQCGARTPCARSLWSDGRETAGAARRPHIHDQTPSPMWGAHAVRAVVVVGRARNRRRGAPAPHPRPDPESDVGRARRARGRCGRTGEKPPARRAGPTSTTKPRSQCGARTPCARSLSSDGRETAGAARRPHIGLRIGLRCRRAVIARRIERSEGRRNNPLPNRVGGHRFLAGGLPRLSRTRGSHAMTAPGRTANGRASRPPVATAVPRWGHLQGATSRSPRRRRGRG